MGEKGDAEKTRAWWLLSDYCFDQPLWIQSAPPPTVFRSFIIHTSVRRQGGASFLGQRRVEAAPARGSSRGGRECTQQIEEALHQSLIDRGPTLSFPPRNCVVQIGRRTCEAGATETSKTYL